MSSTLAEKLKQKVNGIQPQPAVGIARESLPRQNTGSQASVASSGNSVAEGLTGTSPGAGHTAAPGGCDALPRLMIDERGQVWIGDVNDPTALCFSPEEIEAIYDFLHCTKKLWRHL